MVGNLAVRQYRKMGLSNLVPIQIAHQLLTICLNEESMEAQPFTL